MRRAYLLIVVPAVFVGIFYLRSLHYTGHADSRRAPFLGAAAAFLAAVIACPALSAAQIPAAGQLA